MRAYKCRVCGQISSFQQKVRYPICPNCFFQFGHNQDSDTCQISVDWQKVRRRLEDRLRKDPEAVRQCAALLNVSLAEIEGSQNEHC